MLNDPACKNAKPKDKSYRLADEKGLYLEIMPNGSKYFRMKYRFARKEKRLALGVYPEVSLKEARTKRDEARKLLADSVDPSEHRKATKAAIIEAGANSFEAVAREWHAKFSPTWTPDHAERIIRRFERDIFPWLGKRPIREINAPDLLRVLHRIESRGALDTAHRAHQDCGKVFRYAVATGRAERDPSADLRGALPPARQRHHASITDPTAIGELLRAIDSYRGSFVTKCALRLSPFVFLRPGELRRAEWAEIDFDKSEWRIPASKMKMKSPHIVPVSSQAITILRELQPLTGRGRYVGCSLPKIRYSRVISMS